MLIILKRTKGQKRKGIKERYIRGKDTDNFS